MAINLLLADDERDFVDTLAERLRLRDYSVRVVYNGLDAIDEATRSRPDAIILDLFMPGLSGDETLRRIADLYPGLPMILLTGHAAAEESFTGEGLERCVCLTKPVALNLLLEKLRELIPQA